MRSQKYAFFLYRQIFQNCFLMNLPSKQAAKKRPLSSERPKKEAYIYNIVRARKRDPKGAQKKKMRRCFFLAQKRFFDRNVGGWSGIKGTREREEYQKKQRHQSHKPKFEPKIAQISNQNPQKMARESFRSGARFFQLPRQNKKILRPRFTARNTPNFSDRKGKTESLGERKAEHSEGANQRKTNIKQTLPEKNAKFVGLHKIIAFET